MCSERAARPWRVGPAMWQRQASRLTVARGAPRMAVTPSWSDADLVHALDWLRGASRTRPSRVRETPSGVDLRGFSLPKAVRAHTGLLRRPEAAEGLPVAFKRNRWQRLDLRGADFTGVVFDGVTMTDCLLDDARLDKTKWYSVAITRCSFQRASLRHAGLGHLWLEWWHRFRPPKGSTWTECDFTDAVYLDDAPILARFVRCTMHFARLTSVTMYSCQLIESSLATSGALDLLMDSRVDPRGVGAPIPWRRMSGVDLDRTDLSGADVTGLKFTGCTMRDARWPDGAPITLVPGYARGLDHIQQWLASNASHPLRLRVEFEFKASLKRRPSDEAVLMVDHSTDWGRLILELLREAQTAAGTLETINIEELELPVAP